MGPSNDNSWCRMTLLSSLRRLFAAPEQKRSAAGPLIALHSLGRPVWTPRNYAALAREGFAGNPIVYRCVRMIAEAAASVPLLLYRGRQRARRASAARRCWRGPIRRSGPRLARELLRLPAGRRATPISRRCSVDGELRELHVLRPDRMKVVPARDGWPEAYEYSVDGAIGALRQRESVRHPAWLFNPLNDHYGMSPLEAAATRIDIHNAAGAWNKALLDNSARPSGALVYRRGRPI